MQFMLITAVGRVMVFHVERVAQLYKRLYGGTIVRKELVDLKDIALTELRV